jgi:diguanylate cyclase (GGDEF)-like protein/PAS domain S-box-containing protein
MKLLKHISARKIMDAVVDASIRLSSKQLLLVGVASAIVLSVAIVGVLHSVVWGGAWNRELLVDSIVTPLIDASIVLVVVLLLVSRLKKTSRELGTAKQVLEDVTQGITESILLISPDLKIIWGNRAAQRQTGLSLRELVGKNCYQATHHSNHPCVAPNDPCPIRNYAYGSPTVEEHIHFDKDGNKLHVEVRVYPVRDESGDIVSFVHLTKDITARKKAEHSLRVLSTTDELTGLANRRAFDTFLEVEWRRASRTKTPLSVIMMDVDYFKNYNDAYGHLVGDAALKAVAEIIKKVARRPEDLAARFGGEEFAIILSADEKSALSIAKKLCKAVEALAIPHERSQAKDHLTVSLGVASVTPKKGMLATDLMKRADQALYRAKRGGRNRVECGVSDQDVSVAEKK